MKKKEIKQPYQIRIDKELLEQIKGQSIKENRSVNNMIEVLIERGFEYLNIENVNNNKDV